MSSTRTYPPSFERGGQAGALVRALDWERTPLGPIARWPQSLKTTVSTMLHARHPMILWWGPELVQIYNDAFVPSFGRGKHPRAMGQRAAECWEESWSTIGPQIRDVMQRGKASWHEDQLVSVRRKAGMEEIYWTYGYSPVFGEEGDVEGTLVVCSETTSRVLAERRFGMIRALVEQLALATDALTMARVATDVFAKSAADIPFALVHLHDARTDRIQLVASVGIDEHALPDFDQLVREETRAAHPSKPSGAFWIGSRANGASALPGGPWPEPASELYIAPLLGEQSARVGALTFGLSPRVPFDERYRAHLDGIAEQLGRACGAVMSGAGSTHFRRRGT